MCSVVSCTIALCNLPSRHIACSRAYRAAKCGELCILCLSHLFHLQFSSRWFIWISSSENEQIAKSVRIFCWVMPFCVIVAFSNGAYVISNSGAFYLRLGEHTISLLYQLYLKWFAFVDRHRSSQRPLTVDLESRKCLISVSIQLHSNRRGDQTLANRSLISMRVRGNGFAPAKRI